MKLLQSFIIVIFLVWILPNHVLAQVETLSQFINIVNPVRISAYSIDPKASLTSQYFEVAKRNLSATWLFTYDAIQDDELNSVAKTMNNNQELGLFLEVTPRFAQDSGVTYNKTDSWHRASSLFLSGYTQEDRKKLIDQIFDKFKEKFGFYPTSVGSWWSDSFSLEYMKNKYGITANLTCADQFQTDGYHLWGQYWSSPFYPSKNHAGVPAKDVKSKLDLVTIQWAERDPLNGYWSSAYSSQDYFTFGFGQDYFEKLIKLYAGSHKNSFGQITIGLEGDLTAGSYQGIFANQMQLISELRQSGAYQVSTMKDFSSWYRSQFKNQTPDSLIESDDLLNKDQKSIWYQSPYYRIGMVFSKNGSKLTIIDLRTYFSNFQEPYYVTPNFQLDLFINIPSVIDSISDPNSKWEIDNIKLQSIEKNQSGYRLNFENDKVIRLATDSISFDNFNQQLKQPSIVKNSPYLDFKKIKNTFTIFPKPYFPYSDKGIFLPGFSIEATYYFWRPKIQIISTSIIGLIMAATLVVFFVKKKPLIKLKLIAVIYLPFLISGLILLSTHYQIYLVNQAEIDALMHLSAMPYGKVAVVKGGCLICKWQTKYPPAVFANIKDYVGWISHKPIVYNASVFQAKSRQEGRRELDKLGVKYIYIVRYKGYIEEMPFSPGDLNVEKIYENAHSQIWQVH
ncbi:MAG: hypothetical protein Q7R43_06745 [Candidatus Daviesbacteria bacterium]|nr:hypothetical protein [Candidatus Daviesbacteria bacterium]